MRVPVIIGVGLLATNVGGNPHTTSSGTGGANPQLSDVWRSGILFNQNSFQWSFDTPGTFPYFCEIHPIQMQATVTVTP